MEILGRQSKHPLRLGEYAEDPRRPDNKFDPIVLAQWIEERQTRLDFPPELLFESRPRGGFLLVRRYLPIDKLCEFPFPNSLPARRQVDTKRIPLFGQIWSLPSCISLYEDVLHGCAEPA
jgi:hypothetical protein